MAKRKCEQPLVALLPASKRQLRELPISSRHCTPRTVQGAAKRKERLEPEVSSSPQCNNLPPPPPHSDGATTESHPPSKRPRLSENHGPMGRQDFQCQKDDAFREYNSFHFWKTPLPDIDFSELIDGACDHDRQAMSTGTDALEEMDN